jgi:hypothetical protein
MKTLPTSQNSTLNEILDLRLVARITLTMSKTDSGRFVLGHERGSIEGSLRYSVRLRFGQARTTTVDPKHRRGEA